MSITAWISSSGVGEGVETRRDPEGWIDASYVPDRRGCIPAGTHGGHELLPCPWTFRPVLVRDDQVELDPREGREGAEA
jgi:hypothetical protein